MEVEIAGVIFSVVVIDIANGMNRFRVQVAARKKHKKCNMRSLVISGIVHTVTIPGFFTDSRGVFRLHCTDTEDADARVLWGSSRFSGPAGIARNYSTVYKTLYSRISAKSRWLFLVIPIAIRMKFRHKYVLL